MDFVEKRYLEIFIFLVYITPCILVSLNEVGDSGKDQVKKVNIMGGGEH